MNNQKQEKEDGGDSLQEAMDFWMSPLPDKLNGEKLGLKKNEEDIKHLDEESVQDLSGDETLKSIQARELIANKLHQQFLSAKKKFLPTIMAGKELVHQQTESAERNKLLAELGVGSTTATPDSTLDETAQQAYDLAAQNMIDEVLSSNLTEQTEAGTENHELIGEELLYIVTQLAKYFLVDSKNEINQEGLKQYSETELAWIDSFSKQEAGRQRFLQKLLDDTAKAA